MDQVSAKIDITALYQEASLFSRLLIAARPIICPMIPLVNVVPAGSTILDIGCGNGLFLAWLTVNDKLVEGVGCDISHSALAGAQSMANNLHKIKGREILRFTYCHDTLPSGQYDVVSLIDVMHHIPQGSQCKLFLDASTHIRPGGIFVYKDMVMRPWWKAWGNRSHDFVLAQQWINYASIEDVKSWANEAGLILEHEQSYSKYFYGHELLVFKKPN